MKESELKPCFKCGKQTGMLVNSKGFPFAGSQDFVSCFSEVGGEYCMLREEVYTVDDWQSHPRPATRAELVAGIKRLVDIAKGQHLVTLLRDHGHLSESDEWANGLSDINKLLESEG